MRRQKFKFTSKVGSFGYGPRRKQVCMPGGTCEFDIDDPAQLAYMDMLRKAYGGGQDCFKPLASDGSEPPEPEDIDAMLARALRAEAEAKRLRSEREQAHAELVALRAELRDLRAELDRRLAEAPGDEGELFDLAPIRASLAGLAERLRAAGGAGVSKADAAAEVDAIVARLPAAEA